MKGTFSQMIPVPGSDAPTSWVAVLGAGGKTGLIRRLGEELGSEGRNTILTALTHSEPLKTWPTLLVSRMKNPDLSAYLQRKQVVCLMHDEIEAGKFSGISPDVLERMGAQAVYCLFECDGARGRSLKAHNETDPAVPLFTTRAIIVVGADVVNTTVRQGLVHRPEAFLRRWNLEESSILGTDLIAKVVTSDKGYGAKIPKSIPRVYFINKAESYPSEAGQLAEEIGQLSDWPVYVGSVHANQCVRAA